MSYIHTYTYIHTYIHICKYIYMFDFLVSMNVGSEGLCEVPVFPHKHKWLYVFFAMAFGGYDLKCCDY